VARIRGIPSVITVVPFVQRQALVEAASRSRAPVPSAPFHSTFSLSTPCRRGCSRRRKEHSTSRTPFLVIGSELAVAMGVRVGDPLSITSYRKGRGRPSFSRRDLFQVSGIFRTGYYDFDSGLVFMSLETADALYGGGAPLQRSGA